MMVPVMVTDSLALNIAAAPEGPSGKPEKGSGSQLPVTEGSSMSE